VRGADKIIPPSCADCHEIRETQPPGTIRALPCTSTSPMCLLAGVGDIFVSITCTKPGHTRFYQKHCECIESIFVNSTKHRYLATVVFILEVPHSSLDTLHTLLVFSPNLSWKIMEHYFNKTHDHSLFHSTTCCWIIYKAREFCSYSMFSIPGRAGLCSITVLDSYLGCKRLATS